MKLIKFKAYYVLIRMSTFACTFYAGFSLFAFSLSFLYCLAWVTGRKVKKCLGSYFILKTRHMLVFHWCDVFCREIDRVWTHPAVRLK